IATGNRPRGIITSPDGKEIFVCVGDDDALEVIDVASLEITRRMGSGPDPELLDVDPTGERIYIANEDDAMVTVMLASSGEVLAEVPVGVEPEGMRVHPNNAITVATSEETSMAHFIDNAELTLVANVLVDTRPRHAEYTRDGTQVWVSAEIGGTVSVIDIEQREIVHKIRFEIAGMRSELIQPVGMRMSKDGTHAFVALGPANHVAVVNVATYEVERYVLVGQRPWHMEINPDGSRLYVANGLTNDITVIDTKSLRATRSVPVGRLPWGIAYAP
ncbi:MAG: PQQ-dependent catabolism-associated beta-propeller protein, partial [Pseudomonadota bacterium]